jgi:TonB-dependent Receptor Plug Domain.
MNTRRSLRSFVAGSALAGSLVPLAACHSTPGGPVLPEPRQGEVNVAYGSQQRRDVNAAVDHADGDKMMAASPRTVTDMLVGRFPGVEVTPQANGKVSIRIRGAHSMKGNQEPLFVLDGIPRTSTAHAHRSRPARHRLHRRAQGCGVDVGLRLARRQWRDPHRDAERSAVGYFGISSTTTDASELGATAGTFTTNPLPTCSMTSGLPSASRCAPSGFEVMPVSASFASFGQSNTSA